MHVRGAAIALAVVVVVCATGPVLGAQEQEQTLPAQLLEGGKVHLVNDLQAWADSMLVFRQFRRDFRRIDRFEEEDDRERKSCSVGRGIRRAPPSHRATVTLEPTPRAWATSAAVHPTRSLR